MLKFFKNIRIPQNPYLIFSPFLLLYVVYILIFQKETLYGDEDRFLNYANNLLKGYYSPSDKTLGCGPGYPIILTPFVAFDLPFLSIKLMNALFHYLSIVFLFKALRQIISFRLAFIFGLFWACYFNLFDSMHLMYSEIFSSFLMSVLLFFLVKTFNPSDTAKGKKYLIASGFIMGYITLTKVVFGYVLLVLLVALGLLWIMNRSAANYRKALIVLLVAFITTAPYLIYTYKLTGKIYYWSTYGGETLYWMTTHHEGEYGSWFAAPTTLTKTHEDSLYNHFESGYLNFEGQDNLIPGIGDSIKSRHQNDFNEVLNSGTNGVNRDDAFKRIAIRNIKANPLAYIKNCLSNVGRILFNYPYSYTTQRPSTLLRFPLNGILLVLMLFCLIPTIRNWRKVLFAIRFMLLYVLVYLGGSLLGTAEIRMFAIIVPMLLFWIAYILTKSLKVKLDFD